MKVNVYWENGHPSESFPTMTDAEVQILERHAQGVAVDSVELENDDGSYTALGCEWSVKLVPL